MVLQNKLARLQAEISEKEKHLAKVRREALASKSQKKPGMADLDRQKQELFARERLVSEFHKGLMQKERVLMERFEGMRGSISLLRAEESAIRERLVRGVAALNHVNARLGASEKQLQELSGRKREFEEKIGHHVSRIGELGDEVKKLMDIRKELKLEVLDLKSLDELVSRVVMLLKLGKFEQAAKTYDSLRFAYGSLDNLGKSRFYPSMMHIRAALARTRG